MNDTKPFQKLIRAFDRHQTWRVFSDFVALSVCSIRNSMIPHGMRDHALIEEQFEKISEPYDATERERFAELLSLVVLALDQDSKRDYLGSAFQDLELANHWRGQFFTPWEVASMMASLAIGSREDVEAKMAERGFITALEPACGAGVMVLALFHALRDLGLNPQDGLHVYAVDLDETAAGMAYIQMSLVGVPGIVKVANSLGPPEDVARATSWRTVMHTIGCWDFRLARAASWPNARPMAEQVLLDPPPAEEAPAVPGQLALW